MTQTWKKLCNQARKIREELSTLFDSRNNYSNYRSEVSRLGLSGATPTTYIPISSIFLRDISTIISEVDSKQRIMAIGKILRGLPHGPWGDRGGDLENEKLCNLRKLVLNSPMSPDKLMELSLLREQTDDTSTSTSSSSTSSDSDPEIRHLKVDFSDTEMSPRDTALSPTSNEVGSSIPSLLKTRGSSSDSSVTPKKSQLSQLSKVKSFRYNKPQTVRGTKSVENRSKKIQTIRGTKSVEVRVPRISEDREIKSEDKIRRYTLLGPDPPRKKIDKENEVEYYIGQVIDITEKKKYEAKLRDTELRLSSLFDNLQDVVFYESSAQGTFITDNVYEMLGYTGKELFENEGLFFSLIYPDDRDKVEEAYEKWRDINENACSNLEVRLRRKDGNYIWVEDRMFAVKTPERSYWAGFMIDITERKKSEIKLAETENRLSSILNNLSNIVFYENEDRLVFISDNIYEMLGYKSEDFYKNRDMFSSLVHPEDYNRVYNRIDEWFDKGEEGSIKSEFRLRKKDGSYIWVEDIMFTVITEQRKYWTGFFIDVSDRKQAAEKLRETNTRLTTIVKNLTNLTVYETGGGKNYISENIENLTGITVEKFLSDNKLFTELIHPADASHLNKKIRNWRKMGAKAVLNSEFRIIKENGECVWIEDHMFKVKNDKGEEYISGIMIDITEKKKAYEKIQDSEIRLSTILSNLPRIVIYQSGNGKNFISENISEMIGYAPEEILNEKYFFGNIIHPEDLPKVKNFLADWKKVNNRRDVLNMEYRLRKKDGDYIWIEDHMFEVNPPNQGSYLSGILIDMTERKMTEQKITQSLREKEILLKEIHHRVKNNLQVISSLLKLQSQYINDSQASNILLESQNRVRSMALVHQKLYQSEDFARVDFGDYVRQLTINLLNVYKLNNRYIKLNVKADDIFIGVDVAIPCGLIINELVSNSLKYAFNSHENGQIDITLNNGKNGCYNITVKDNGIGFPSNLNFRDTKSLGLQLVNTLVNQIEGKIEMETYKGTSFTISFNDASQNSLVITSN